MFCRAIIMVGASAAIAIAGPAVAQRRGNSGSPPTGVGAGGGARGPSMTIQSPTLGTSANVNAQATLHSEGPENASATGISHSSSNSVLARGSVSSNSLPGLTTGLTVNNSSGTSIGTVSQVITGTDGSIRAVVVTSPTGQTFRLPPSSLSISGNVVTTTSTTTGG